MISCEKKPKYNYENLILGDWIFENEIPKRKNYFYSDFGYSFEKNGNCESKPGYLQTEDRTDKEERKTIFYGTKTKYRIVNDSLYILNLVSKKWDASQIAGITSKNLKLKFEKNVILNLSKLNYKENKKENFDKIIISKSPCFGSCPINDIEINRNGEIYYRGSDYNTKNGFFKSKIKLNDFKKIEIDFKKTNFLNLKDNYSANWTDDQEVSITFVKDNKIIKSIKDYGRQSPKLFRITLEPITYLYQNLKLQEDKNIREFQKLRYFSFEKANKIITLSSSEAFFLCNLMSNAKTTDSTFKASYFRDYETVFDIHRIETDGRYFKIIKLDKSSYTLDLGFDFFKINELSKRLQSKTKYD